MDQTVKSVQSLYSKKQIFNVDQEQKVTVKFGNTVVNPFIVKALTLKIERQGKIQLYTHKKRSQNNFDYLKNRYSNIFPTLPSYTDMRTVEQKMYFRKSLFKRVAQVLLAFNRLYNNSQVKLNKESDLEGLFSGKLMAKNLAEMYEETKFTEKKICDSPQNQWLRAFKIVASMTKIMTETMQVDDAQFTVVGDLSFNPNYFKIDKESTVLSADAKFILSQSPSKRSPEDIQKVINCLQAAGLECFCNYPYEIQKIIAKIASYIVVTPKRVIIRQGMLAENFFFIIGGRVRISKLVHQKDGTGKEIITFLHPGASFGELDMVNHSLRRFAARSINTVQLLTIERNEIVNQLITYHCDRHIPDHIKFLVKCKFMQLWPIEQLINQLEHCFVYFFKRDVVVVEDSLSTDWLYIMKTGICKVIKKLNKPPMHHVKISHDRMKLSPSANFAQIFELPLKQRHKDGDGMILESDIVVNDSVGHNEGFSKTLPVGDTVGNTIEERKFSKSGLYDNFNYVCVQIDLLKCRDVFGLDTLVFDDYYKLPTTDSVSLISGGAEIVMLSKKFFIKNATETVKWRVRKLANSYPNDIDLDSKLESQQMWSDYKMSVMSELVSGKVKMTPKKWE